MAGPDATPASLPNPAQRVAELEAEVARLRSQLASQAGAMLTLGGFAGTAMPPSQFTITGLEEQVLLVDADGHILYANTGMAELLGAPDKQRVLKTSLSQWDAAGRLPAGFLTALVEATRAAQQTYVIEHEFPAASQAQGGTAPATPGAERQTLRFVGSPVEGRVQVLVQDVTHLRWVERSFARYVSQDVINLLLAVPPGELLRTERKQVTVLFTDLRGFSTLCQNEPPDSVCILLNQHFQHIVEAVHRHRGTVDKLIGDSVMAVFGAPLATQQHALQALLAAVDMLREHTAWVERRVAAGWPVLHLSVGIATGEVVAGNVGTPERMDFTVLGHTVNLASRLVREAQPGQLLTEPATHRKAGEALRVLTAETSQPTDAPSLPHLSFTPVGTLRLKNIDQPVDVLAVKF